MLLSAMFVASLYLTPDHIKLGNSTCSEERPVALYSSFQQDVEIQFPPEPSMLKLYELMVP